MEFSEYSRLTSQRQYLPRNAHFWQVGLLDIVLSEYPDKSYNFKNFIFMTSSLQYSIVTTFLCINNIILFLFLFPYFKCYFCTSDATSSHTQSLQSVVTESGMAEEVKMVNDSIVQKGDKNADLSNKSQSLKTVICP